MMKMFVTAHLPKTKGLLACVFTAIVASILANTYQAPVMLLALLLGLALHFLYHSSNLQSGIIFCSSTLLRAAVALVGIRIAFSDIVSLGFQAPALIIVCMVTTIVFGVMLARLLGLPLSFGVLSGGSVAVCGVSAAAAIATVLPKNVQFEKFFALTVVCITALGTMAMIFYPIIVDLLGLSEQLAGVFLGGSIHDVAQVAGAGYSVSEVTGDIAMYIKLMRVALLMPIVMIIFVLFKNKHQQKTKGFSAFIPSFLVIFFLLAIVNNLGFLPEALVEAIKVLSQWLLVVAMVAIGMKTSLSEVLSVGWKPVFLLAAESLFFAAIIMLGVIYVL